MNSFYFFYRDHEDGDDNPDSRKDKKYLLARLNYKQVKDCMQHYGGNDTCE